MANKEGEIKLNNHHSSCASKGYRYISCAAEQYINTKRRKYKEVSPPDQRDRQKPDSIQPSHTKVVATRHNTTYQHSIATWSSGKVPQQQEGPRTYVGYEHINLRDQHQSGTTLTPPTFPSSCVNNSCSYHTEWQIINWCKWNIFKVILMMFFKANTV